jgi:tripartite-type tricarboxylate transporter receptor subunit TctC
MNKKILCTVAALSILFVFPTRQESQAAAPYYEGKIINIIVGFGPGGGYDRFSRVLAKHLPRFIPGKPTVLVQNVPGGGSMTSANQLFNLTKPDGLTICTFNRGLAFAQLLKAEGVRFDVRKFSWVGSPAIETAIFVLRTDLPFKTLDDILKAKEPIMIGSAGGPSDNLTQFMLLLKQFLKINMKVINYTSGSDVALALERKEVDGRAAAIIAIRPQIERNELRCWIRGRYSVPEIAHLPVDEDLTTDKIGKTMMSLRSTLEGFGRPYVAPPGTPEHIMNILRDAFAKAVKDPAVMEDMKKNQFEADNPFVPPEECLRLVNYILNQPESIVKEVDKYIKF